MMRSSTSSFTLSSTSSCEPALHTSPWLKKMPQAAAVAAASRSGASAMMMFGVLPPHSSDTRFMLDSPAYLRNSLPTSQEPRSEEHTSELQSLMRISYDVFCLKNIKLTHNYNTVTR